MFHNHATPRCIYITANKLLWNKLSQSATHLSHVKLLYPRQHVTSASMPKLLQMLSAALVSCSSGVVEVASELTHASIAKRRLLQVMEQLGSASGCSVQFFGCRDRDQAVGSDWLQSLHYGRSTTVRLRHSAVWNMAEMTLEINLYEQTAPFERCVMETEQLETQGNSLRFWNRKYIKWAKKLFCLQICCFLGGKFPYVGMY
jgi:hypothetical protein